MIMKENRKRGVSPVVSTVLLIAIVIVIIAIIFLWSKGFIKESIQKQGLPAEQSCSEVKLEVSPCYSGRMQVTNVGNVPVYRVDVRKYYSGQTAVNQVGVGVGVGESIDFDMDGSCPGKTEVMPLILGTSGESKKAYTCLNNIF